MKTELFSIFSDKQIQAIKDCIRHGMWGNADCIFGNVAIPVICTHLKSRYASIL